MNPKIDAIAAQLRECGKGFRVHHEYIRGFHSFRMESNTFTHHLHIPWKLVHDWNEQIIERLIRRTDCFERFAAATQATYLCLLEIGARDVGEDFLVPFNTQSKARSAEGAAMKGASRSSERAQGRLQHLHDPVLQARQLPGGSRYKP